MELGAEKGLLTGCYLQKLIHIHGWQESLVGKENQCKQRFIWLPLTTEY